MYLLSSDLFLGRYRLFGANNLEAMFENKISLICLDGYSGFEVDLQQLEYGPAPVEHRL